MPRQTRQRRSGPSPLGQRASDVSESLDSSIAPSGTLPIFDTTFSFHRASPLSIGSEPLDPSRLGVLANRLRDVLIGDVVRGIEVGLGGSDGTMGSAGALELVTIEWVALDVALDTTEKGLQLTMQYENAISTALLLPQLQSSTDTHFLHLPLLLLRAPVPLKAVIVDFLSSNFDCRVGPLRLGTKDLVASWEDWIRHFGVPTKGPLAKDAVLTLGFRLQEANTVTSSDETGETGNEGLGIKALDVIVPGLDLRRFVEAGGAVIDRDDILDRPFTDSLAQYLKHHLALDLSHPAVQITRIACAGFVLSEKRIKIFAPSEDATSDSRHHAAVRNLLVQLINRAKGTAET